MAYTYTPEQIEFVKTAWADKTHTLDELAKYCNTSVASVRMKLVKMGLYTSLKAKANQGVAAAVAADTKPHQPMALGHKPGEIGATLATQASHQFYSIALPSYPLSSKAKLSKGDYAIASNWFDLANKALGEPTY